MKDFLQSGIDYTNANPNLAPVDYFVAGYKHAMGGESGQSHMVLVEREAWEKNKSDLQDFEKMIQYLQEKEVQQDKEYQLLADKYEVKNKLLKKAYNDYDEQVKILASERKKIAALEAERASFLERINRIKEKNNQGSWLGRLIKKIFKR